MVEYGHFHLFFRKFATFETNIFCLEILIKKLKKTIFFSDGNFDQKIEKKNCFLMEILEFLVYTM